MISLNNFKKNLTNCLTSPSTALKLLTSAFIISTLVNEAAGKIFGAMESCSFTNTLWQIDCSCPSTDPFTVYTYDQGSNIAKIVLDLFNSKQLTDNLSAVPSLAECSCESRGVVSFSHC